MSAAHNQGRPRGWQTHATRITLSRRASSWTRHEIAYLTRIPLFPHCIRQSAPQVHGAKKRQRMPDEDHYANIARARDLPPNCSPTIQCATRTSRSRGKSIRRSRSAAENWLAFYFVLDTIRLSEEGLEICVRRRAGNAAQSIHAYKALSLNGFQPLSSARGEDFPVSDDRR